MAKRPCSSLRVTVPQGVKVGGAEEGVVDEGQDECHNMEIGVEIGVEEVDRRNSKDDCIAPEAHLPCMTTS